MPKTGTNSPITHTPIASAATDGPAIVQVRGQSTPGKWNCHSRCIELQY